MTLEDFAKYVIDNMSRATLQNALKITERLSLEESNDKYNIADFCNSLDSLLQFLMFREI